jgi:hypothetical protein
MAPLRSIESSTVRYSEEVPGQPAACLAEFDRQAMAYAECVLAGLYPEFPSSFDAMVAHLRSLPQSNDDGECTGTECDECCYPHQRSIFLDHDPNCWERSLDLIVSAYVYGVPVVMHDGFKEVPGKGRVRHAWVCDDSGQLIGVDPC